MEASGTKGWEGRAAPGKWHLGAGEEEEGRGMEGGGRWAGSPVGVEGLRGASGNSPHRGASSTGCSQLRPWGRLPLPHLLPAPACCGVPCKGVVGWGSLSQVGTPQPEGNLVEREHRQIPTGLEHFSGLKQTAPKTGMFRCWK